MLSVDASLDELYICLCNKESLSWEVSFGQNTEFMYVHSCIGTNWNFNWN
jgi:hypothetical protein